MRPAEGGVDAAQYEGRVGKGSLQDGDGGPDARVPVGHRGGYQDQIGPGCARQVFPKPGLADAVAGETARNTLQSRRVGQGGFKVGAAAVARKGIGSGGFGMKPVEAVHIGQSIALPPQQAGQGEQPQGLGPHVIGGEIVDPGIDQEDMGRVGGHDPSSSSSTVK